jgi:hypothetical protein
MVGDILPKCEPGLGFFVVLILGPVFWGCPHRGAFSSSFLEPWLTRVKTSSVIFENYWTSQNWFKSSWGHGDTRAHNGTGHTSIGIRSFLLLRNRCKYPFPCDLHMFEFIITLIVCFMMMVKAHRWGIFSKCRAGCGYQLVLGSLIWGILTTLGLYGTQRDC